MNTKSKEEFKSYLGIGCHLFSSSYHSSRRSGTFSVKYNNIYRTSTFDDLWCPQYCSERENEKKKILLKVPIESYWMFVYRIFLTLLFFFTYKGVVPYDPSPTHTLWPSLLRPSLGRGLKCQGELSFGVAMTSIQTFLRWGHMTRDLVTCPWVTWVWNFSQNVRKDADEQVHQKRRRYLRKTWLRVSKHPPARCKLTHATLGGKYYPLPDVYDNSWTA